MGGTWLALFPDRLAALMAFSYFSAALFTSVRFCSYISSNCAKLPLRHSCNAHHPTAHSWQSMCSSLNVPDAARSGCLTCQSQASSHVCV